MLKKCKKWWLNFSIHSSYAVENSTILTAIVVNRWTASTSHWCTWLSGWTFTLPRAVVVTGAIHGTPSPRCARLWFLLIYSRLVAITNSLSYRYIQRDIQLVTQHNLTRWGLKHKWRLTGRSRMCLRLLPAGLTNQHARNRCLSVFFRLWRRETASDAKT